MEGTSAKGSTSSQNVLSSYRLGKTLGIGAFGKVKLALHIRTGLKVAIKIFDRQSIHDSDAEKVTREINILRLFSHPHIVHFYEVIETQSNIYVVMEYMNSGELFDYITENGRLQEDEARHFFQQIISGVECCHLHMVVHRDLKPENLLLDSKGNVKIADFGLSNTMHDGHFLKTTCGSPNYAAPEVISEQLYAGPEVDVWSCGVILYALLCARLPFDDNNLPGLYAKIKNGVYPSPNHLSYGACDLIERMLAVNPINRISIHEIRQHPWFQQHLPRYISIPSIKLLNSSEKVEEDVLKEMVKISFDVHEVLGSLHNSLQNEATVTYYLLLDKHFGNRCTMHLDKLSESSECLDYPEVYLRSLDSVQHKWTLGFKSQVSPHETMTDVLGVLQSLNIRWKKIGHYNMKCLWLPPLSSYARTTVNNGLTQINHIYDHELSVMSLSSMAFRSNDAVKFEVQIYKASGEFYVLDLQKLCGPPFFFIGICAAFIELLVV